MLKAAFAKATRLPPKAEMRNCLSEAVAGSTALRSSIAIRAQFRPAKLRTLGARQTSLLYVGIPPYDPKVSVCRLRIIEIGDQTAAFRNVETRNIPSLQWLVSKRPTLFGTNTFATAFSFPLGSGMSSDLLPNTLMSSTEKRSLTNVCHSAIE